MSSNDLNRALRQMTLLDCTLEGNESLLSNAFGAVKQVGGMALRSAGKAIADKTVDLTVSAIKKANTEIIKHLGTRRLFISHIYKKARDNKESYLDLSFSKTFLNNVTRTGVPEDLIGSADALDKTFGAVFTYTKDLEAYYRKHLSIIKSIDGIKTTEDAVKVVQQLDSLKLPSVKLHDTSNSMSKSESLPGGYVLGYNEDDGRWTFKDEPVVGETNESYSMSLEDIKSLLTKLNSLGTYYQDVSKANNAYVEYLKTFNTVVGKSFQHLESLKGEISASLLSDLKSRLNGDQMVFSFYIGFLPKLMIYLDDYVDTLSSYLSKQFN